MAWLAGDHDYALELFKSVLGGIQPLRGNRQQPLRDEDDDPIEPDYSRTTESRGAEPGPGHGVNERAGARAALGEYLYHMGKTAHRQGQFERAQAALVESLVLCDPAEDMRGVAIAIASLAVGPMPKAATCSPPVSSGSPTGSRASTASQSGRRRRSTTTPPRWRPPRRAWKPGVRPRHGGGRITHRRGCDRPGRNEL